MFPAIGVIIGALLLGPLSAVAGIAIISGIYKLLGKLFGGVGTYSEMFRAVVTSSIPQIWLLPMWLIWRRRCWSTAWPSALRRGRGARRCQASSTG